MGFFDKEVGIPASNMELFYFLTRIEEKDPNNEILKNLYKRHGVDTPEKLVTELREDGSNTIGRWLTGSVDYNIVVQRVALKIGIKKDEIRQFVSQNEMLIVRKLFQDYIKKNPEAREKLDKVLNELGKEYTDFYSILISGSGLAFISFIEEATPLVLQRILMSVVGLNPLAGYLVAGRIVGMAIPILNIVMGAWLVLDISGPAYRKIVPSVCEISLLKIIDRGADCESLSK